MRQFNSACGFLMFLLLMATLFFGRQGGVAPHLIGAGFVAVALVWLVIHAVAIVLQMAMTLARSITGDAAAVPARGRRIRQSVHVRHAQLPPYDLIERLCVESGWLLTGRQADLYQVRPCDPRAIHYVDIRYKEPYPNVVFQCWFPIRFPLQQPSGLSERLLMRNKNLHWSSWTMTIGQSCEACLYVGASIPPSSLNAWLFGNVCQELVNEVRAFHQELHDRFRYSLGGDAVEAPYLPPQPGRSGVPQRRGDNLPGVWYVGGGG
jgi:hypothetical protein